MLLEGEWRWRVSREAVAGLVARFEEAGFQNARGRYDTAGNRNHNAVNTLSLAVGGRVLRVADQTAGRGATLEQVMSRR